MMSCVLLLVGCGGNGGSQAATEDPNLRALAMLYNRYQIANEGRPPANEAAFKEFIERKGEKFLELAEVDSVDALFTSQRDGQPYVVLYGNAATQANSGVVAYERQGVDGVRYVGYRLGYVEEADETKFKELTPKAAQ